MAGIFGDIFDTAEDIQNGSSAAHLLVPSSRRGKNCAHYLDLPMLKREISRFVGLKNQGATCYLNSLIQAYYMAPEFRNAILQIPLCNECMDQPSSLIPSNTSKYKILLALQTLFSDLRELDVRAVSTEEVTKSFGWANNEQLQQQDIQEANRVIFDALERAVAGTIYQDSISKYYKGISLNYLECLGCGLIKEREEPFYDLILQVKGYSCLEESLLNLLTLEKLEGSNQYFCEQCNSKQDAYKGLKIRKFPPILTMALSRFELDYTVFERKKINDHFSFNLELDISFFAENPQNYHNDGERIYELSAVLIHRGDAYGGHYHAYIRDTLNEGDWFNLMHKLQADRLKAKENHNINTNNNDYNREIELMKKEDVNQNITHLNNIQDNVNQDNKVNLDDKEKLIDGNFLDDEEEIEIVEVDNKKDTRTKQTNIDTAKKAVNRRKRKKNQNKRHTGNTKQSNNVVNATKEDPIEKKEEKKPAKIDDTQFDEIDFPTPYTNKDLAYNWFDFNDSSVTPIPMNRIQHQFGGSSENAYILIYRQRKLSKGESQQINVGLLPYQLKRVKAMNEAYEMERITYKEAEMHIELIALDPNFIDTEEKKYLSDSDPEKVGQKIKIRQDAKFKDFICHIANIDQNTMYDWVFVEVDEAKNKHLIFKRIIDGSSFDLTLQELKLEHYTTLAYFKLDDQILQNKITPVVGEDFIPININLRGVGSSNINKTILSYPNKKLLYFRIEISDLIGIPYEKQLLLLMEGEGPKHINKEVENDDKQLKELGIHDNCDLLIKNIEELVHDEDTQKKKNTKNKNEKQNDDVFLSTQTSNLASVLIEADDYDGTLRYYVDLDWTLGELLQNIKKKMNLDSNCQRRLRKLNGNTLFYEEEFELKLRALSFEEGGVRLRLERGKIPQFGNLAIRVKTNSKFANENSQKESEFICFPNETLQELKRKICEEFSLDPSQHKLYCTDWLEEPIQVLNKEDKALKDVPLKLGDLLIIKDKDSVIPKEVINFHIYYTKTGAPNDTEYVDIIQIREEQLLEELKNKILLMPKFIDLLDKNLSISHMRLREMRKDMFFGKILRNDKKMMKKFDLNTNSSLVVQILNKPENLDENDIVLLLRKRDINGRAYANYEEYIFTSSKDPTISELKEAIIKFKKLDVNQDGIELAKYYPYEFSWKHIHRKYLEEELKTKNNKKTNKKQTKKNNKNKIDPPANDSIMVIENLRKAPYLLKDGDIIGYRLESENIDKNDDFQTIEDEENRLKFQEERSRLMLEEKSTRRSKEGKGFIINMDDDEESGLNLM